MIGRMLWLPDVLEDAGLRVAAYPGWEKRYAVNPRGSAAWYKYGPETPMDPRVVIGHHTATHPNTSDSVVTELLVKGRVDLPGPLSQLGLNRLGTFYVLAAGKANHAGAGRWKDATESKHAVGIEAYNWGNSVPFPSREPWPKAQLEAYERGVAAILSYLGRSEQYYCGHREWAYPPGRKPDPSGINLDAMRLEVGYLLRLGEIVQTLTAEEIAWLKAMIAGANAVGSNPDSLKTLILDYRSRMAIAAAGEIEPTE